MSTREPSRRTVLGVGSMLGLSPLLIHDAATAGAPAATSLEAKRIKNLGLPAPSAHTLRYSAPATDWESQALPLGNGRFGAMMFGAADIDRVHLNLQALWGGVNNYDNGLAGQPDGAYDTSMTGFGSYRNFGNLYVQFAAGTSVTSPGGPYNTSSSETVAQTIDGQTSTKWCIDGPPAQVIWQAKLAAPKAVSSYSLTSANDVPERDPAQWQFQGSNDGSSWTTLNSQSLAAPFESRFQTKTFTFSNTTAYGYYRFVFTPRAGVSHFQVAEIALAGVTLSGSSSPANYRRLLDPATGVHVVSYDAGGGTVTREAFASRADDVLVLRYATTGSPLTATLSLTAGQENSPTTVDAGARELSWRGVMGNQLKHACVAKIASTNGTVTTSGSNLVVSGATSLVIIVDGRTNYRMSYAAGWRGPDPDPTGSVRAAAAKTYDALQSAHLTQFGGMMNRVSVNWGTTDSATLALTIPERLSRYNNGGADPSLEQTMFHLGRYLLASSSRNGGLPANLQGLWNQSDQPAWASDYHTNINVQMNYWGAETTDLPDSHLALINFVKEVSEPSRAATKHAFGANVRGWTARTSQSIFGGNSWEWNTVASAWYAQHIYEHWAFTQDRNYLANMAFPMMKDIGQFWEDRLVQKSDGLLYSPNGWSPEHGPREDGVMYDQQIIWDLFQNILDAYDALYGTSTTAPADPAYRAKIADLQRRLAPNKIGRWGQLQEWQEDIDDPNDNHRHTSHLFAVYPGRQITPTGTPALAAAALVSLKARCSEVAGQPFSENNVNGDSRRSWTWPWRTALFARLGDGERARYMIRGLIRFNTLNNLFCNHPPFQLDGNFGITGGIAEMLLQSHAKTIAICPALPSAWAAGSFTGLRARGGYRVDATWSGGRVTNFTITADRTSNLSPVTVRVNGATQQVTPRAG